MKIQLLAFASAGDILGERAGDLELPDGSRIEDLQRLLEERHPELAPLWPRLAVAVDGELAGPATPLRDGAEVALLPPVSGGSGAERPAAGPETRAHLTDEPLDAGAVQALVADPADGGTGRGAVLLFLGVVRDLHRGRPVRRLSYSAYRSMATARLGRIVAELEAAEPDLRVAIVHRLGDLDPGEPSVVIATASPHRAAAYEASRLALERLKAEVPIWKKEHYADGAATWREEESLVPQGEPA